MRYFLVILLFKLLQCTEPHQESSTTLSASEQATDQAQAIEVTNTKAPDQGSPERSLSKKYPQAKNVKWNKDKNGYHEAHFELNGVKYRADFTDAGEWVQTESSVKFDELPQAVKNIIKADFDKGDIVEIEKVEDPKKGTFYDVEFDKKKGKVDIEIKPNGAIIGKDDN